MPSGGVREARLSDVEGCTELLSSKQAPVLSLVDAIDRDRPSRRPPKSRRSRRRFQRRLRRAVESEAGGAPGFRSSAQLGRVCSALLRGSSLASMQTRRQLRRNPKHRLVPECFTARAPSKVFLPKSLPPPPAQCGETPVSPHAPTS